MKERCPQCRARLPAPEERSDGFPGIKYQTCHACGWSGAVTTRERKVRLPRKPKNNPPLAMFMANPPMRHRSKDSALSGARVVTKGTISEEAHSIKYRHAENGALYEHKFEHPVSLIAAEMGGKRVVIVVGSKDDIWDDYPYERGDE